MNTSTTGTKVYETREERLDRAAKQILSTPERARDFLISAGVLDKNGQLAAHLR